ncbi:MAG TPA: hypothetical protein VFV03_07865, partial [Solirubrobacteraceae bacterium]|nr:hypothetical protein [Solirubrobacteraceae bacterium]
MTLRTRIWLLGTVACAVACVGVAFAASAALAVPEFGVERFVAANCKAGHEACGEEAIGPIGPFTYSLPKEPTLAEAKEGGYTQAAGRPPYGITAFNINTVGAIPNAAPTGIVTHVRTDVAPGVSTNPEAVAKCSMAAFGSVEPVPGTGFFPAPTCGAETEIGVNKVIVYTGSKPFPEGGDLPLEGKVYNLVQPEGRASDFGVALELPKALTEHVLNGIFKGTQSPIEKAQYFAHTMIEGSIEWAGNYHDYYEINVSPALPLIASRLVLFGNIGNTGLGGFITNPSNCSGPGPLTTNTVTLKSSASQEVARTYTTPIGPEGCLGEGIFTAPPFEPEFKLSPETSQSDRPDGITTEVIVPHAASPASIDTSQVRTVSVTLPEGMTLNPSAGSVLEACTPAQARIHSRIAGTACPAKSQIASVTLNVPDLPPGSLTGSLYLGGPETGPITGPPYTVYIDAESARYGISTRLRGEVVPNEATGRVTATFAENPEQPFSNLILHFKTGALAPIANPLVCGPAKTETSLVPYTGTPPTRSPFSVFVVESIGGGACPSPLPFSLTQSATSAPTTGGANTNFTLNLARGDGQQYLSKVSTVLPAGLVGKIPVVPLCPEPQASLGTCSSASQIGTATTTVGSGPLPIQFSGPVYLTGPTGSAPYGMTVAVNAAVGPFSLGLVVVHAGIEVDPITARVTVASALPTIVKGVPLRMKTLSVAVNRQGFLINPTNCGALTTNTTLTSTFGATQSLATPFQATGCSSLAFKPKFTASSNGKTSRANGASLVVKVGYPAGPQANIKSVLVTVPKQLPSRLSTLKNACREAVFNANPYSCPSTSRVGGATVTTPVLPAKLTGPAFFVSHGGAAFPDLDLVMSGNGVTVILVGNTNIENGITTTNFAATPDVPVSSFEANLPVGKNSAVTAVGNICKGLLVMPTTITAQNGKVIKQNTLISVSGCPVTILSRRVSGHKAIITVKAPAAGRVSGSGTNLNTVYRHPRKAQNMTLEVPLSAAGRGALAARSPLAVRVRVGFLPK